MTAILYFGGQKSVHNDGLVIFNNGGDQKGGFVLYWWQNTVKPLLACVAGVNREGEGGGERGRKMGFWEPHFFISAHRSN